MLGVVAIGRQPVARARPGIAGVLVCRVRPRRRVLLGRGCWSSAALLAVALRAAARQPGRAAGRAPSRAAEGPVRDEPAGAPAVRDRPGVSRKGPAEDGLRALGSLAPYLWPRESLELRVRVVLALAFLLAGKLVNIYVPLFYKHAVDALSPANAYRGRAGRADRRLRRWRGSWRRASTSCATRSLPRSGSARCGRSALSAFRHVHALSLRFHLERRTGGLARAVERGTAASSSCSRSCCSTSCRPCSRSCWSAGSCGGCTIGPLPPSPSSTIVVYIAFTFSITDWRVRFRREMNERNTEANTKAVDSLLNFETVKYFANEEHEARRYDAALQAYERAAVKSETTLTLLNIGQGAIIAVGLDRRHDPGRRGRRRRAR